jgi:hypothetical protein
VICVCADAATGTVSSAEAHMNSVSERTETSSPGQKG